jgi:glycosyltransferase involved in cell wall biosynthesis
MVQQNSESLKVLALTKYGQLAASSRHRFFSFIPHLATRGVTVTAAPLLSEAYVERLFSGKGIDPADVCSSFLRRLGALISAHDYDVLWIEGELFPRLPAVAERILASVGPPYVVDLDDAIFHTYDRHPWPLIRQLLGRKIDVVLSHAAAVTAGNEYLADRALKARARRVVVVPTAVDDGAYARVSRSGVDTLTFGWIGSPATQHYLDTIQAELQQVAGSLGAKIKLIGARQDKFSYADVELRQWNEESEIEELSTCDIGLAPLFDGPWERGKCGLKAIQYMAAGMPVLAADVGALSSIVVHGETGFLYLNGKEFTAFAQQLAADPGLRRQMGNAGRRRVAGEYSVHRWVETLQEVLTSAARKRTPR